MKTYKDLKTDERNRRIHSLLYGNEAEKLSPKQRKTMLWFYNELVTLSRSEETISDYIGKVKVFGEFLKGKAYEKYERQDGTDFIVGLNSGEITKKGQPAKLNYLNGYKIVLRVFFKMLLKLKNDDALLEPFKLKRAGVVKTESDVISQEEIKLLVNSTENYRDRFLLHGLYESALRKSEFMALKIKDVKVNPNYAEIISVSGKTGFRKMHIPLITSYPDLVNLLNNHPRKDDPEAPLFLNLDTSADGLGAYGLNDSLRKYQKKAGLKKKCYPHIFRHSRLTHLGELGWSEMELRMFAGWTAQSPMAATYCHIGRKTVESKMLKQNGIATKEAEQQVIAREELKPVKCPRCEFINSAGNKYCGRCGSVVDLNTAIKQQEALKFSSEVIDTTFKQKGGITRDLVKEVIREMIQKGELTI